MFNTIMLRFIYLCFLVFVGAESSVNNIEHDHKGFDDNILFSLNWPGSIAELSSDINYDSAAEEEKLSLQNKEVLKVTTSRKEVYHCHLPDLFVNQPINIEEYDGPSPLQLLKPLFSQKACSYRLESYWSYEVCHGRYVRQYHEERDGKEVKSQEYFLGHWSQEKTLELEAAMTAAFELKEKPKLTKIDGLSLPYVELIMKHGTMCDLSGLGRVARVRYVCYKHGKNEIYSFKETLTCEYEIIVLSQLLCTHPQFRPQEANENSIDCVPEGEAPKRPRSLLALEAESQKLHHQSVRLSNNDKSQAKDVLAVLKVEKIEKDGETHLKFELRPLNEEGELGEGSPMSGGSNQLPDKSSLPMSDDSPVRSFLNGETCLSGGNGWWKYEFCYGKHVQQYHIDRTGVRTAVLLGSFDEKTHLDWIKENKSKAPKPLGQRTSISHFYANGDVCDKTGKPRQTEVKLKCIENSSNSAQVSLYLLEPKTCHYILGVESPLICNILPVADENGLVESAIPNSSKMTSTTEKENDSSMEINDETAKEEIGND